MFQVVPAGSDIVQLRNQSYHWPSPANIYLIRMGREAAVVDTGLGAEQPFDQMLQALSEGLAVWDQTLESISTILLTHTHVDHAGGAMALAKQTGANVLLPEQGWTQASDPWWQEHYIFPPTVRQESTDHRDMAVQQHFREACMPDLFTLEAAADWRRLCDGDEVRLGRYRFKALHTPGHDVGHLAFYDADHRLMLTGDLLEAAGTALPWYPPNAGGIESYLESLRRLLELEIERACPGHGDLLEGVAAVRGAIRNTMKTILRRDRKLVTLLMEGAAPFAALDNKIYPSAVRNVIPWASSVTWTHISRLERLGILMRRPDGDFVVDPIAAGRYQRELDAAMEQEVPLCGR